MKNADALARYFAAALDVGTRRNLLTTDDAEMFAKAISNGSVSEATGWATGVEYDLAMRCRSFRHPDQDALADLAAAAGAY